MRKKYASGGLDLSKLSVAQIVVGYTVGWWLCYDQRIGQDVEGRAH
jgi:hypothetical protein